MSRTRIRLRTLTGEEEREIRRPAASRKEPFRLVQRARIIAATLDDPELTASEASLQAGFRIRFHHLDLDGRERFQRVSCWVSSPPPPRSR